MPLPAALQARLAKRGLLKKDEPAKNTDVNEALSGKAEETNTNEAHYRQIPLLPGWFLVPDHASGASYYWNTITNQVSWLHPLNPKAQITNPSADGQVITGHEVMPNTAIPSPLVGSDDKEQVLNIGKHPSLIKGSQKKMQAAVKRKQQEQEARARKRKVDDLDPLDPAAYADVPRGTWSTGLVEKGEAKTGVDTTANGPLFQQRPYPSPGEVLRRNAGMKSS